MRVGRDGGLRTDLMVVITNMIPPGGGQEVGCMDWMGWGGEAWMGGWTTMVLFRITSYNDTPFFSNTCFFVFTSRHVAMSVLLLR